MDRRHFLTSLGGGLAEGVTRARAEGAAKPGKALLSAYVTNVDEMLGPDPLPVRRGAPVVLERSPARADGLCTIAVAAIDGRVIGYLPTNQARVMAPLLDAGFQPMARVAETKEFPRPAVRIEIGFLPPAA